MCSSGNVNRQNDREQRWFQRDDIQLILLAISTIVLAVFTTMSAVHAMGLHLNDTQSGLLYTGDAVVLILLATKALCIYYNRRKDITHPRANTPDTVDPKGAVVAHGEQGARQLQLLQAEDERSAEEAAADADTRALEVSATHVEQEERALEGLQDQAQMHVEAPADYTAQAMHVEEEESTLEGLAIRDCTRAEALADIEIMENEAEFRVYRIENKLYAGFQVGNGKKLVRVNPSKSAFKITDGDAQYALFVHQNKLYLMTGNGARQIDRELTTKDLPLLRNKRSVESRHDVAR
ncbi:MAG: hypothetical protein ACKVOH_01555 [Chlamydiales bacterium]